ncbi:MAG TPA: glycine betaine ABC transporter substrate-binding protein [Candidatus Baltobacteraceae bacterium]|nr:glycine betaine ABC transporter substrate-binding protein [Candidatus Baltobacteraceae bacterium]
MNVTRGRAIALAASTLALPSCASSSNLRVGSKNFTESIVIAEIYAQALEAAGFRVERRFNLGSTQIVLAAMARGEVDLYPEYTGTALIDVLRHAPVRNARAAYDIVRTAFARTYGIDWLDPSPMNDSQGLATTAAIAKRYGLRTLTDLARVSSQLRLATIPEFVTRPDGLPGLARTYGMSFAAVKTYDIALKYQALLAGSADVATAFTTDGAIAAHHLVVLADDRHLWPPYNVAPLVRHARLVQSPHIATALDAVSPHITDAAAQSMNASVENDQAEPSAVAAAFLRAIPR